MPLPPRSAPLFALALLTTGAMYALGGCASSNPTPVVHAAEPSASPPPIPSCGVVDVEDHSSPPVPARVAVVRDATRQKLAALGACTKPFRLLININVDQTATGRLQAKLRAVIYRTTGEVIGDLPTTLSAEHTIAEERTVKEAELLRTGGESTALLFAEHFH